MTEPIKKVPAKIGEHDVFVYLCIDEDKIGLDRIEV